MSDGHDLWSIGNQSSAHLFQVDGLTNGGGLDPTVGAVSASDLLKASLLLPEDNDCLNRARRRSLDVRAPASHGKPSREDCEVVEHYLELSGLLKRGGFASKRVFVSSNSKDYRLAGHDTDAELEAERGCLIWSFDMRIAGKSGIQEIQVDAGTGNVLSVKHESARQEAAEKAAEANAVPRK